MTSSVGKLIRQARQSRGISLRQLAARVEIHFSHLSKIENGKDQIGRESLLRVANELELDADMLLGEAGYQSVPFRVLGRIAAGLPIEAIEDSETFDLARVFDPHQHFLLRVRGDSMILDGIHDGDLAIIRATQTARNGETVVAVVENRDATLKRFRRNGQSIILSPAHPEMTELAYPASTVEIRGVLAGLLRTSIR